MELHYGKKFEKKIIGIRPGEKIDETLLTTEEVHRSTTEKENEIVYAKVPKLDANIGDYFFKGDEHKQSQPFTSRNTRQFNAEQTLDKIKKAGLV